MRVRTGAWASSDRTWCIRGLQAMHLARPASRGHVLYSQPRLVVCPRTLPIPLSNVSVNVSLRHEAPCPHTMPDRTKAHGISTSAFVSNSLCDNAAEWNPHI